MVDSFARILAYAALEAAESGGGGGGGRSIEDVYILDEHLHIVYSTGDDIDIGQVVGAPGADGKVYVPHIDPDTRVLSWTIEDKEGEVPDPVDLSDEGEWQPVTDEEGDDNYYWEDL